MSHHEHDISRVRCAVVTVSDSRNISNDGGGDAVEELLRAAGHSVEERHLVPDEIAAIRRAVIDLCRNDSIDAVVLTGGTGITARDVTPEAVESLFERPLPGFGEAFRRASFDEIGPRGLLSRATGGIIHEKLVFLLPGSVGACRLGVETIIGPFLGHALAMLHT